MNSSLYSLDRVTHLKIALIAAIAAAVVFVVGKNAQLGGEMPGIAVSAPHQIHGSAARIPEAPRLPTIKRGNFTTKTA